ncbi:MAG: hypothetical protein V1807_02010 [Patescibacteria group bacterium]
MSKFRLPIVKLPSMDELLGFYYLKPGIGACLPVGRERRYEMPARRSFSKVGSKISVGEGYV